MFVPVVGFEGVYEVSSSGVVTRVGKNVRTCGVNRKYTTRAIQVGNILKQYVNTYPTVVLSNSSVKKTCVVHRLVAEAFIPNMLNKRCVNHIDGNPLNNNINNLEWCTHSENTNHAISTGLFKPYNGCRDGDLSSFAKLTSKKVSIIKLMICLGLTQNKIAKIFNVVPGTISFISRGVTWRNIDKAKVKQMSEYMTSIDMDAVELGIVLPRPDNRNVLEYKELKNV